MGINPNHNQTIIHLIPGRTLNHNQTIVRPRPVIVAGFDPGLATNHNQTLVRR